MDKQELLKTAKPILFNSEMVRAILEGRKTVTRRVVKPQPAFAQIHDYKGKRLYDGGNRTWCWKNHVSPDSWFEIDWLAQFAPYQKGDILYVRETWSFQSCDICGGKCGTAPPDCFKGEPGCYVYRTNYGTTDDDTFPPSMFTWRPSIHMPKSVARIFLKVTDVRVERLQDITSEQIDREGYKEYGYSSATGELMPSTPAWFRIVWDSTINPSDLSQYGWNANPWVWVYSFEVICHE